MAKLEKKQLLDLSSHYFLLQNGFVNLTNSFPSPCYKDPNGRIFQLDFHSKISSWLDLTEMYFKAGFVAGKHQAEINQAVKTISKF